MSAGKGDMSDGIIEIGSSTARVFVPSRRRDGGIIESELRNEWLQRTAAMLENAFGGCTPFNVTGSFVHDDGRITRETMTVVTASCPVGKLGDAAVRERVLTFGKELCAALGQEKVFVGWGDTAYLVEKASDPATVPVVPFSSLSPDSQARHLTMGWGGIRDASRVLQVLSLDTWTMPSCAAAGDGPLTLRAVLDDGDSQRRAWSWTGDLAKLREGRRGWSGPDQPTLGDLVFFQTRPNYLDVVLVTRSSLAGPRDLRLSQGQLNPVTRHLLLRILRREWPALERDLDQKGLNKGFFPKLQRLRAAVEDAIHADEAKRAKEERKTKPAKARKAANAKPSAADLDAHNREMFRSSVLVVGRMMFLRFLAQKGWIPSGADAFIQAFQAHGDGFFEKYVLPLWFDVLNVPATKRTASIRSRFPGDFPYLNGGLFQPREREKERRLPAALFDPGAPGSFLSLFRDFEFSLNEHAGSDDSLKIDPSLFGKALESFNTLEARKKEGVHYTPKPIAWALALEAILARVTRLAGVERQRLEQLLNGERTVAVEEAELISDVLGQLRIVDPAVGSGVLLWAALEVMLALDSACNGILTHTSGYQRGSREWGKRSRHFVCNCLYGVDLSEEAVELTRLRLWLAVALSESRPAPLPDLELNIARGDSLLPRSRSHPGKAKQLALGIDDEGRLEVQLERLTRKYLEAGERSPENQRKLREQVLDVRRQLAARGKPGEDLPFDWRLFFPHVFRDEKGGFDVVVANPPYLRIQGIKESGLSDQYRAEWSTLQKGNADLSYAFVELAVRDLAARDGGQVAFIQPSFRHHDAAAGVRALLLGKNDKVPARLRLWVDFDDAQVFPTATNYVALLFAERTPAAVAQSEFEYSVPYPDSWQDSDDIGWMRARQATHPAIDEWLTVEKELRERVLAARAAAKRKLADIAEIHVGIQTSADGVFLFDSVRPVGKGTIEVTPRGGGKPVEVEAAMVRRCMKGSSKEEFHVLFPYDGRGNLLDERELAKKFPKAWAYLLANKQVLESREKGKFTGKGWYRFGRKQGYAVASLPKVIVPSLLDRPIATLDSAGQTTFTASGKGGGGAWGLVPRPGIDLGEVAAVLQSPVLWDWARAFGSPQQGGWRGVDREVLANIPA